jgi:hypothetical protein
MQESVEQAGGGDVFGQEPAPLNRRWHMFPSLNPSFYQAVSGRGGSRCLQGGADVV